MTMLWSPGSAPTRPSRPNKYETSAGTFPPIVRVTGGCEDGMLRSSLLYFAAPAYGTAPATRGVNLPGHHGHLYWRSQAERSAQNGATAQGMPQRNALRSAGRYSWASNPVLADFANEVRANLFPAFFD
jgi:hypothetical protein